MWELITIFNMTNKCNEKVGIVKALLKFLDTNEIEGKIFFGSIGIALIILSAGLTIHAADIIQAIKCK